MTLLSTPQTLFNCPVSLLGIADDDDTAGVAGRDSFEDGNGAGMSIRLSLLGRSLNLYLALASVVLSFLLIATWAAPAN